MTNPLVHALVFVAAVVIPGGLLVYFAWRLRNRSISLKGEPNQTSQKEGFEDIPDELPSPDEALKAYLEAFPKYSKESLRARSRASRLRAAKTRPRKKSQ
tara:strand:+ start:932 stop:1231 length:300 start_codon:yes stop_codon:yes gene_type:complete